MGRMLTHLKTVPGCWAAVRKAGLTSDEPHAGEGSKLRLREAFDNPKIVPACPAGRRRLIYDDGDSEQLLPREKNVLVAASRLGGCIEDWVRGTAAQDCGVAARHALWLVVRECLRGYPFYQSEFEEVLGQAVADITDLQPQVLHWDVAVFDLVTTCLAEWRASFSVDALVDDTTAASVATRRAGTVVRDANILPIVRFAFEAGQVVVLFGDPLQAQERTHFLAMCECVHLQVIDCGWNLAAFRDVNFSRVGAVHCNISGSWETKDGPAVNHDWGAFVFQAWTAEIELWRAGLCRVIGHVIRLMWKLFLQGRALGFYVHPQATAVVHSRPFQRVRSTGTWSEWHSPVAFCLASSVQAGANSLVEAWGFPLHCN